VLLSPPSQIRGNLPYCKILLVRMQLTVDSKLRRQLQLPFAAGT
jgi:hypothetical protein